MIVVYSPRYQIDIGPHVFPTRKYSLVHARLVEDGVIQPPDCIEPDAASWTDLALVHTAEYLDQMRDGTMSPEDAAQLELPWSREMVDGFRLMTGGTVTAALIACGRVHDGRTQNPLNTQSPENPSAGSASSALNVVCHLGGGLHHAFPNHGEGFCPFNDAAVAARVLQARGIERIAIVDLDVHHGNGTAFTFNPRGETPSDRGANAEPDRGANAGRSAKALAERNAGVFTFSMHQQHNYPMWKPRGSLDIGLADGARDATYLRELERALPAVMAHAPQCVFYLAGADPYEDDQLGGLRITREGLCQRDRLVIGAVRRAGVPLAIALAGGYARRIEDTVAIHCATVEEARRAARG